MKQSNDKKVSEAPPTSSNIENMLIIFSGKLVENDIVVVINWR